MSAALFLAAKCFQDGNLRIQHVVKEMGCGRFTEPELKAKEQEILRNIGFDTDLPTVCDVLQCLFGDFLCQHNGEIRGSEERQVLKELKDLCMRCGVLCCYDYSMLKYK
jgi:hypothetical protein